MISVFSVTGKVYTKTMIVKKKKLVKNRVVLRKGEAVKIRYFDIKG